VIELQEKDIGIGINKMVQLNSGRKEWIKKYQIPSHKRGFLFELNIYIKINL